MNRWTRNRKKKVEHHVRVILWSNFNYPYKIYNDPSNWLNFVPEWKCYIKLAQLIAVHHRTHQPNLAMNHSDNSVPRKMSPAERFKQCLQTLDHAFNCIYQDIFGQSPRQFTIGFIAICIVFLSILYAFVHTITYGDSYTAMNAFAIFIVFLQVAVK